jgi:hypothetical protein
MKKQNLGALFPVAVIFLATFACGNPEYDLDNEYDLIGNRGLGEDCTADYQCRGDDGLICRPIEDSEDPQCALPADIGGPCEEAGDCSAGMTCEHGLCEEIAPASYCYSKDCRAYITGDASRCYSKDCRAYITGDASRCYSKDCRAYVTGDASRCYSKDCRAYVTGDASRCYSRDCRAHITGEEDRCYSRDCTAYIKAGFHAPPEILSYIEKLW